MNPNVSAHCTGLRSHPLGDAGAFVCDVSHGGAYRIEKASLANGRPLHTWQATHLNAVAAATALLPYLRIKRAQAENLLTLRPVLAESVIQRRQRPKGQPGPNVRAPHLSAALESIYANAKELNRVGR